MRKFDANESPSARAAIASSSFANVDKDVWCSEHDVVMRNHSPIHGIVICGIMLLGLLGLSVRKGARVCGTRHTMRAGCRAICPRNRLISQP